MGLADLFTPENYRTYILPALGITEAIATSGRSPGTAAMGQMQAYDKEKDDQYTKDRQAKLDAQTVAKEALQNRLGTLQIKNAQDEGVDRSNRDAAIRAIQGKLGKTPEEKAYFDAFPEKYGEQLKPVPTQLVLGGDGQYHAASKKDATDAVTGDAITAPPKPVAGAIKPKDVVAEEDKINKDYEKETANSRNGVNLISADLAYKGVQKTLDAKKVSAADVLAVKDQLVKMVNPGQQITQVQFGHTNIGGVVDKLKNIVGGMSGDQMLDAHQKTLYKATVARLASDLVDEHNAIKKTYLDRAHQASIRLNLSGDDTLKVALRPLFDGSSSSAGSVSDDEIIKQAMGGK